MFQKGCNWDHSKCRESFKNFYADRALLYAGKFTIMLLCWHYGMDCVMVLKMDTGECTLNRSLLLNQTNTPIKRLGLSRKRKSCGSGNPTNESELDVKESLADNEEAKDVKDLNSCENTNSKKCRNEADDEKTLNLEAELENVKQRVSEKEAKLKLLQETCCQNSDKVKELEELLELWKNGFQNALSYLLELLRNKQPEHANAKKILQQLGIWQIYCQHFENEEFSDD